MGMTSEQIIDEMRKAPAPPQRTIGKLAEALAKAQAEIVDAPRDRENPFFKSKYATLSSVWNVIRGPFTKNGLAVVQCPSTKTLEGGRLVVVLTTRLLHSSGEEVATTLEAPVAKADVQGIGSAITYLRRYSLQALGGVAADDDDDGNAASREGDAPPASAAPRPAAKREPAAAQSKPEAPAQSGNPPTTFPNYGRAKGEPIKGAHPDNLRFYLKGAQRSLADQSKAKFHDKERALLNAIGAELARQDGGADPMTSEPSYDNEPPPPGDEDGPF